LLKFARKAATDPSPRRGNRELLEAGGLFGKVGDRGGDSEETEKCKQARP